MYHCCEMFKNIHSKNTLLCVLGGKELDQENLVLDIGTIVLCSAGKENDNMLETTKQHLEK